MLLEIFVQTFEADGYSDLYRVQPLMHAPFQSITAQAFSTNRVHDQGLK